MEDINVQDRVEVLEFEFKGQQGVVIDIFEKAVVVMKMDNFEMPVATMIRNVRKLHDKILYN